MPDFVQITEVSPRDGLQNEKIVVPTSTKLELIRRLNSAGMQHIEAASFVSPKWVPQMGDASEVWAGLPAGPRYSALVPNARGLENALAAGVESIAVFTAASEAFVQKNINMSIEQSLDAFRELIAVFRDKVPQGRVRGYLSTIFECPYAGRITPDQVAPVLQALREMGCDEVSLGDTIGAGSPAEVRGLAQTLGRQDHIVWHFHDTRGTAVANAAEALNLGFRSFDSSAGGLGGCPYAPGAGGNLATEDLVYLLHREGFQTGINLRELAQATLPVLELLGRTPASKAQLAELAACR